MRRALAISLFWLAVLSGGAASANREHPLRHPAIREVLLMMKGGVADDVVVERVRRMPEVPELDADAIRTLTNEGVPDRVLLVERVVPASGTTMDARLGSSFAVVSQTRDSRSNLDATAAESIGLGRIQIVAKSSLPVTYLQVLLDGDVVARRGEIEEGETKPGWTLPRPPVLNVKNGTVVFECALPAGRHEVQTTFALSRIVETEWDDVVEARGQRYDTTKVGPIDEDGGVPVCDVPEGKTCIVLARLVKKGDGYTITYDSKVR